ncbi:leucine-rich repeat domain-containing protein [Dyadobacter luteus]|uniref:Leucine-rich repeat domain-containing protein n=1 Tax=Dyadobacter luteus TaxID=2259619 RepID=A0A3D8YBT9_9BACT|nr:leucine-rich repeat domain-containing protein [Dyadobacter luteus]REA61594.1 leucine-rich repeat domain-containing protein [Dyadobacter luteus]
MKIVLTMLILLVALINVAQPVVKSKAEVRKSKLSISELDKHYPDLETDEVFKRVPASLNLAITKALNEAMGPTKVENLLVSSDLYLNKDGNIDYLIFDAFLANVWTVKNGKAQPAVISFNKDSVSHIISQNLSEYVKGFISKRNIGKKSKITILSEFNGFIAPELRSKAQVQHDSIINSFEALRGSKKVAVKKDSVVNGIQDALLVVDTLKIKQLYIENSLLKSLPDLIYRFPNLELLSLMDNDIEQVNIDMSKLRKLKNLNLSGNILTVDSVHLSRNKTLQILNLQRNVLQDVPAIVKNCKRLETLWLGRNPLSAINDKSFRRMKRVKNLNLYKTEMGMLPNGVKKLKRLEVLDLYRNNLTMLPSSVCQLKKLTHLAIAYNHLTSLPDRMNRLKRLNVLYAHHNWLSKLPPSMVKLKNLQIIDLGYNWFTDFPEVLTTFSNLDELDISANNLTEFPKDLLGIKKLNKLHLRGNPFLTEDREVKYGEQFGLLKSKNIEVFY